MVMMPYTPRLSISARMASAMAPPAAGSVPDPNSSMRIKVFLSACRSMDFMSSKNEL